MTTALGQARGQRTNNRFAIWIATFESDAKRDWQDLQGEDEELVTGLLEAATRLWTRSEGPSQHTIATRAQQVGLSPREYLAVFLSHLPDLDAVEEKAETMAYLAQQ